MAFHAHDGWHFERTPAGHVRMTKRAPVLARDRIAGTTGREDLVLGDALLVDVTFFPTEWASIMASVSARGETADTYRQAERFHAETSAS